MGDFFFKNKNEKPAGLGKSLVYGRKSCSRFVRVGAGTLYSNQWQKKGAHWLV